VSPYSSVRWLDIAKAAKKECYLANLIELGGDLRYGVFEGLWDVTITTYARHIPPARCARQPAKGARPAVRARAARTDLGHA
jgi:hypothetical protein